MHKEKRTRWIWYAVLIAVAVGLFAPTMVANAGLVRVPLTPTCEKPA